MKSDKFEKTANSEQAGFMPDTILYPATDDTEGVVELAGRSRGIRSLLKASKKRKSLHPLLEKLLPYYFKKVYYDFSVMAYVVMLIVTFALIIGGGILASSLIKPLG